MTTANTKENTGYVFENKGKWYARITYRDTSGNRRNVKRTATDKKEAAAILRELRKKLATQGKDIFDKEKITFVHLADYYEQTYLIPAKIVNGQKVEGLRSLKRQNIILVFSVIFSALGDFQKLLMMIYGVFVKREWKLSVSVKKRVLLLR